MKKVHGFLVHVFNALPSEIMIEMVLAFVQVGIRMFFIFLYATFKVSKN